MYKLFGLELPVILGIFSGAITNTPSLGAGQQILAELGFTNITETMGTAYAMAYPFGICGILLTMWLIRLFFKIKVDQEAAAFEREMNHDKETLSAINVRVTNPNLAGLRMSEIPGLELKDVICSRLKRGDLLLVPKDDTIVNLNDYLHLVGEPAVLHRVQLVVGELAANELLTTRGTDLRTVRVVVTNEQVLGKKFVI